MSDALHFAAADVKVNRWSNQFQEIQKVDWFVGVMCIQSIISNDLT